MLAYANEIKQSVVYVQEFTGYNHNLRCEQGQFYDMKNMSLDHYPVISNRQGEDDKFVMTGHTNGLWEYAQDTLMAVSGNLLRIGITPVSGGQILPTSSLYLSDSEKSFATIGQYTVIMPDKVVFDAENNTLTNIVRSYTSENYGDQYLVMHIVPCDIEGNPFNYEAEADPPEDTTKYWYNEGVFKVYDESTEEWVQLENVFAKFIPRISAKSDEYERPTILNETAIKDKEAVSEFFSSFTTLDTITYAGTKDATEDFTDYVIFGVGEEEDKTPFLVLGMIVEEMVSDFTVKTKCPDLSHLVALNNRVWGVDNNTHHIYASKLGDPFQWYNFAGIASDSWSVELGFTDEVTAGVAYNNYIYFFTEDKILKFYGDYPSNFQLHTTKADGVISGGHDAVLQVEGILFYVSPIGVMAYDGSFPQFYGQKFSPNFLNGKTVVAGKDGTKYCLSVSKNGTSEGVFVLDTKNRTWTIGGDQIFVKTAELNNALCFINNEGHLVTLMDRTLEADRVMSVGSNIFSLDGREDTDFIEDD